MKLFTKTEFCPCS